MKEALYLDDSYLKEFEATIKEVNNDKYIILDQTIFYPNSGGQPHDTGKFIFEGKEYEVVYVGKFDGKISHEVDKEGLKVGDKIKGIINWKRRYKLMRMHTAAHLLSAIFHDELGALITGNQKDVERSRMDFSLEDFDRDKITELIKKSNEIIKQDIPVKVYTLKKEEALKISGIIKLANKMPPDLDEFRIVQIGDIDTQADGGTHVKSSKEIGEIVFLKAENKGKSNRRVYFGLKD
ncbi:MAG: alanyl-tRNA editing protein AlaXM [Candidatus Nanoarchaeia archaeon]|nr:alanyl-tRNA editing protein AlaXM [Candidatus Nanoarchaeia archaeon]